MTMIPAHFTDTAALFHAAELMQQALDMLDGVGETRAATHLQHALDTLQAQLSTLRPPR